MRRLDVPRAPRQRARGRGAVQRRHRAGRPTASPSAAVVGGGFSLADASAATSSRGAAGGHRHRPGGRLGHRRDPQAHARTPRSAITISLLTGYAAFVPAERARRLGRARRGHRRHLHGRPRPAHHPRSHAAAGPLRVGACSTSCSTRRCSCSSGCSCARSSTRSAATRPATWPATPLAVSGVVIVHAHRLALHRARTSSARSIAARASARGASSARGGSLVGLERACAARSRWPPRWRSRSTTDAGAPFPQRDLIIFLTFAVIFVTLVVQGLTLPARDPRRRRRATTAAEETEELRARLVAAKAALDAARRARGGGVDARRHDRADARALRVPQAPLRAPARARSRTTATRTARSPTSRSLQLVLAAQREALVQLRSDGDDLERGDEPRHPRARPRGVAARDLISRMRVALTPAHV